MASGSISTSDTGAALMSQPKCQRCLQVIRQDDTVSVSDGRVLHLDCQRPHDLSREERGHLYACAMLPEEVRRRAQDVRDVARRLVKESQQSRDRADVLMREAEAAIA